MAVGKNKRISKSKKGSKKKAGDSFLRKEWYDVKAPSYFTIRQAGRTICNKSHGTKLAVDSLKGRVFEINLADLQRDESVGYRKILLSAEDVEARSVLCDFYGMDTTRHNLCFLIRKWHTLIEAVVDVQTSDKYVVRLFAIGFTQRRDDQQKSTCYAKTTQVKRIRAQMVRIMQEESKVPLAQLVKKFVNKTIETSMEKRCSAIFPLQNVLIRKAKIVKKPKFDAARLMELHTASTLVDAGQKIKESEGAQNLLTSEVQS